MGTVLHDHPDPAAQITVVGARQAAAIEGHGMDPFAMAMSGLSGEDAEDMRAVIEHIRQRKGPGVPIDAKDAELLTRSFHGRDRMEQAGYQLSAHSRDMKFPRGFGIDIHHNHRLHLVPERHGDETNWYARIVHAPHPMGPRIEHTIRTSDEDLPSAVQTFLDHPDIQAEMEHQRTEGKAIHEQIRREGHLKDWDGSEDAEEHNSTWCHVCDKHHETAEEADAHDSAYTDWDEEYPRLPAEMHRGLAVDLPPDLHAHIHDKSVPPAERARLLDDHIARSGYGHPHWTPSEEQAAHYSVVHMTPDSTHVILHAKKPAREDIETDPDTLDEWGILGFDRHEDREIPLRHGADVHVTGVSWAHPDDREWAGYRFANPVRHMAATYADGADARDDNYNGDPDIGIYWQAPAQQQWLADEGLDAADEAPGLDDSLEWPDEQQLEAEGARQVQIQRRPQKRQQEEEQPWWPEERGRSGEVMHSAEDFLSRVERELPGDGEDEEDEEDQEDEDHHMAAHGDAPAHGREPRAGHPGSYDQASTEGQGDPAWSSDHPVPDKEVDQHFFNPEDPDDPHRTQVRYITVTSVTINDTQIDDSGDAPEHGLIPRAQDPQSYDERSTELQGDPKWTTPVTMPGKSKQKVKHEDNGATIGMYPGGVEAGEGPGLSIGAIATKGHALPPGDELGHMQAAHGHDAGWAAFMAKHLTPEQIEVTHNLEHSGRNDPHDREEDWLAAGDASGYHEFIARMAAANGWQPGDERDIDIYRAQQAGQPPSRTYRDEMSDRWHEFRNRSQPDVIHRGIWADDVPPEVHDLIHDPAQPRGDRAHALLGWLTRASDPVYGGHDPALGQHWTPHIDIAHRSILNQAPESDVPGAGHSADVIFHAKMPGARNEIRDEKQRAAQEVGYGYSPDEHEVFLREGTPLRLTGVSWREHEPEYPMEPYEHHDFDRPVRHEAKVPWTEHQRGQLHAWQDGGPGLAPGDFVPSGDFTNKRPTSWATGPEPEGGEGPGEVNEPIRVQAASEEAWEDHLRERHGWDENDIAEAGEHQGVRRLHDFLHELGIADHSHGAGEMTPERRQEMHKRELGERFGLPPRLSPHMRLLQPERGGVPSPDPAHSMMESVPAEVADPEELAEPVRRAYYSSLHAQIALQAAADAVREQDAAAEPWDWPIARAAIEELGVPLTQGSPKRRTAKKHLLKMFRKAASSPAFRFEFTAAWRDVVAKAKRIRASGGVRITAVKGSIVIGQVRGDHDVYESGLQRYPGRVASIFAWSCGCPWASFHQDKDLGTRYAGRPCSHVYALQLEAGARTRFGRKPLQPDPALDLPYSEVVVKSLPPWGPGGWQQTWTAPATLVPVTSLKKAAERYVRPAKVSEMMQHLQHHHGIDPRTLQNADPERMWHFHGLEHDENPSLSHQHTEPEGLPGEQRWPALFTEPDYAVDEYGGVPVEQRHELGEPGRTAPFAPWKYSLNSLAPVQHVATPDEARDWDWPPEARDEWERQHMAPAMRAARLLEALGEPREDIETLARVAGIVHLEQAAHLENPHTRGHEWYHGTQAHKEDLARGFADPAEIASSAYEMPEGEGDDPGHWNRLLGTHFAADHAVADEFAQGEHQGSSNEGYGWDWDDPEEHQGIVHARLGIHNPKHYASEHDMDHEAYEHEFAAGNHPINHLQDYGEDEDEANEIREEMWPHAMRIHRDYGTEKIPESTYGHYLSPFERHPMRTAWLNTHPDKWNIADRFKKRLMDQGHDGITYGNEYEKSRYGRAGNTSAIAFHPHQIEVTQHHHVDEDCHHTAARERPDVEIPGYEGSIGPSPAQYNQTHVYARDVTSGAGNCVCGRARDDDHMHFEVTAATNWDRSYGEIPEEIHRGLYAPESHRVFGLPSSDEDIAHMLIAAHQEEHYPYDRDRDHKFGTHWTADENVARNFAHEHEREHHADDQCPDHDEHFDAVPVVFHAQRPERHEIEDDPRRLGWQNVDDYDTPEQEVTIRHGAPVRLTGVSWQQHTSFGPVWHRHDLREPRTLRAEDRDSPDDPNQWNASLHQAAANDPWGDDNTMLEVPPKPYGATSPPERDTDPGSYGPLAGPDPENWGEIQENSVIQQPLSTDAALAFSLEGPDTGDWVPERQEGFPYSDQAATAGPSTSIEPRDPQGIRMEEAWRRDSHEEIARHITEEHHDLAESLAQAYPGEGPDAWDDRSIGERGLSFAHGADHYERALGRRPDSLSHDHDRDGNVIRRDEFRSAPSAYIAPPRSKPELMDHINTEHGITYSGSGEPADRFLIELHHKFHDGVMPDRRTRDHQHEFPEDHPIDPVFGMLWPTEAAGTASPHDRAAPQLDGAIAEMKDEPEPALDPEGLTAEGNPPVGGGNADATDKASLATWAAAEDPYRPADLEEHYRTHHSWKGGLEVLTRQGIDPAEYHRLMHRTPGEYFTVPHEHFGMSENDQAALRGMGFEAAMPSPDTQAGAHVPVPGDYPLESDATGGGPGMSRHDEVLSPADVSIQSMGTQQWSGGDYNSADEAAPELEHHDSTDNIVTAFQRSAAASQYASDGPGAAQGPSDTDVAAAARAYLSKTADVLPEAEASALIAEGRGERARNLDLLDLAGTHYAEENEELKRKGVNLDDFDDDVVAFL